MPTKINNLFSNSQFQKFVEFAEASKAGSIARAGLSSSGKPHDISATTESWFSKIIRSPAAKDSNEYTRDIFRDSIAKMFGGEDKIPANVKEAMHMEAFDKGKPLTARRILAVKAAIDQVASKFKTCVEAGKNKYGDLGKNDEAKELIETAYISCNGNLEAMDIVEKNLRALIVNGEAKLRAEAEIQKNVEGLIANLNELKGLSSRNPGIYAAGKTMLMNLGKPLPQGMIAKLVKSINDAPINNFRKLSGSSTGLSIHKATMQFYKAINSAMISAGAESKLDDANEKNFVRYFVGTAILSRCSKSTLEKIRNALNSDTTAQLKQYYSMCNFGEIQELKSKTLGIDIRKGSEEAGGIGFSYLDKLMDCLNQNLTRLDPHAPLADIQPFDEALDLNDLGGTTLINETISMAREVNAQKVNSYIDQTVEGSGEGADAMKKILKDKLGEANDPSEKLGKRLSINACAMMNWTICGEMKKIAQGETSQFEKDIYRSPNITLIDGKKSLKLSGNFNTARNELAQFITGDSQAKYETLSVADKNKVHLMMALISQETEKAAENGVQHALHKRESQAAYHISTIMNKPGTRTYTIEKLKDGGISLNYSMDKPIVDIRPDEMDDEIPLGDGSSFSCTMNYTLKGTEFNRLSELNYQKFNDEEAYDIFNNDITMPDGSKQAPENRLTAVMNSFSQEFKINATCILDFNMKLMPSNEA